MYLYYIYIFFAGIGRTLIPRYFRSIFEGGVTDLRYELRHPKESFHNTSITMDCDQCVVATLHGKPMFTKVSQYFFLFTSTYSGCCYLFLWLSLLCMTTSSISSYNTILYVYYSYYLVYCA